MRQKRSYRLTAVRHPGANPILECIDVFRRRVFWRKDKHYQSVSFLRAWSDTNHFDVVGNVYVTRLFKVPVCRFPILEHGRAHIWVGYCFLKKRDSSVSSIFFGFPCSFHFILLSLIISRRCKYGRRLPSESRHMRGQLGKNSLKFRDRGESIKAGIESWRPVIDPSRIDRALQILQ